MKFLAALIAVATAAKWDYDDYDAEYYADYVDDYKHEHGHDPHYYEPPHDEADYVVDPDHASGDVPSANYWEQVDDAHHHMFEDTFNQADYEMRIS